MPPRDTKEENHETVVSCGKVMAPMTSDYNQLNQSQSTVWKFAQPLFARALRELVPQAQQTFSFRVADLGCATGGNSVAPLNFVSQQLVELGSDAAASAVSTESANTSIALEVFLGDLPQNAWSALVSIVTPESITQGHQRSAHDTFVYMVGRTFSEVCAAPNSLDLSYSLVAVHWMKSFAGDLPSGLYATDPLHVPQPELWRAWKTAGARDFFDFTTARRRELKVGGQFIGAVACPKENGHFPWSRVGLLVYRALATKVAPDIAASCVLPCCWRNEDEVRAGFLPEHGWDLQVCEFHETKDPIREQLERNEISPNDYAKTVVESFKAVCHPTCVGALAKSMPLDQVESVLNEAYTDCVDDIAADPEQYNLDVSFWYVVAKKVNN